MEKPANNQHPINDLLRSRWSPRAFSGRSVEAGKLSSLFEAARWSPSGLNQQPWSYLFVTRADEDAFEALLGALAPGNREWAQNAPVLVLTLARLTKDDGTPNPWAKYDLGQSVAHLSIEAVSQGLAVHQMGGFDAERARREFEIPDELEPVTIVAIGYPGDPEGLPESFRQREMQGRSRKRLEEFVFEGSWARPHRNVHRALVSAGATSSN